MTGIIDSLSVSLSLDTSRFLRNADATKRKIHEVEQAFNNAEIASQRTGKAMADSFKPLDAAQNKLAKTLHGNLDKTWNKIVGGVEKDFTSGKYKFTPKFIKAFDGFCKQIEVLDKLGSSLAKGHNRISLSTAKSISRGKGFGKEFKQIDQRARDALQVYGEVSEHLTAARKLQNKIIPELQQKMTSILRSSPKGRKKGPEYYQVRKDLAAANKALQSNFSYVEQRKAENAEQYSLGAKLARASRGVVRVKDRFVAKDSERLNFINLATAANLHEENTKSRSLADKAKLDEKKRRDQETQIKRSARSAERDAKRWDRETTRLMGIRGGGLETALMLGGGAFLGERMLRGVFDSVERLQKIESQVDTWNLSKKDRYQFDLIADKILQKNSLLSRAEATDATLAGMTSMGHFDPEALKKVLPTAVQYAQGSKMLGYTTDSISDVIKNFFGVVEARQQTLDPDAMLKTFKTLWQIENVTGGKVTVKDFETILRNLGPGAPLMSDDGLLNLVAFAEQIKVAGHGGGGGAGAGISTVGNLIKMLQLTASGKPTSINAKKMMSELFNIGADGKIYRLLDTESGEVATQGGITFTQAMSDFQNIAQQTIEVLNGADKEIAKAGFQDKQGMWDNPVKTMGAMRDAFLRGTYLDRNGKFDEKKARRFYRDDQIDAKNGRLKNVTTLDEQKAITSLIAQMGFQHRTTTAMATFMNPFFLKRSQYTIDSSKRQMNPMEWLEEQYAKGNWGVASQEFTVAMTRLGESMKPLVAEFADITRSVSKFITAIAEFNENHPMLAMMNGLLVAITGMVPALGLAAMGFKRLHEAAVADLQLKGVLQRPSEMEGVVPSSYTMAHAKNPNKPLAPLTPQNGNLFPVGYFDKAYQPVSGFCDKVTTKFTKMFVSIGSIVGKIGGLFLKMLPVVGTAFLAFDLASIVAGWFSDINITVDGETKKLGDIIEERLKELKDKLGMGKAQILSEAQKPYAQMVQTQNNNAQLLQGAKTVLQTIKEEGYQGQYSDDVIDEFGNQHSAMGVLSQLKTQGLLNENAFTKEGLFNVDVLSLTQAIEQLTKTVETNNKTLAIAQGKTGKGIRTDEQGRALPDQSIASKANDKIAEMMSVYQKIYEQALAKLQKADFETDFFGYKSKDGSRRKYKVDNILEHKYQVQHYEALNKEDEARKEAELKRIDDVLEKIYAPEKLAFQSLSKEIKGSEEAIAKFGKMLEALVAKQFKQQGQSELTASGNGVSNYSFGLAEEGASGNVSSVMKSVEEGTLNKEKVVSKDGKKFLNAIDPTSSAGNGKPKNGTGTTPSYYVPQNVKFVNSLQATIDENQADLASMLAGHGKKGMEYAKAFVLAKLLNGGLSLSNKNPQDSPYLKKKGDLSADNVDWNKKDDVTKKTLTELAQMKHLAEQSKLMNQAISKIATETAKAEEDYENAAFIFENGGTEKLPSAVTSFDRAVAKALTQIDKSSKQFEQLKAFSLLGQLSIGSSAMLQKATEDQKAVLDMKKERETYGLNSTQASRLAFERDMDELRKNKDIEVLDLRNKIKETQANQNLTAEAKKKEIDKANDAILKREQSFNDRYAEAQEKWLRDNATAGQRLVLQWTDLSTSLDEIQSEMMNGFIDMTEQMLDGNLDSWRDYAYNLLRLIRRQILQGTFAPLLSQITGMMNQGIAGFFDNDVEAMRQKAGYYQAGNVANAMLGNGFYSNFVAGNYFRTPQVNPYDAYYSPYYTHDYSSALMSDDTGAQIGYTGSINDGTAVFASSNAQTSWWKSFTTSFSEGIGDLWSSTKNFFGNFGDNMGKLSDGFLEFCGSPIESLKNAFSSASTAIGQFIMSLSGGSSGSGVGGIISSVVGAVVGGIGASAGGSFGLSGAGLDVSAASNANYFAEAGKAAFSGSAWTRFAKGGVMSSNGELDLRKYASGGIANSPQLALFGEGSMPEAYVPLPDGRSIPVSFRGAGTGESVGGNNISIVINVSNTNNGSTETQSSDATSASKDNSDMTKLANRIKALVRQEIVTQSRPGGLLAGA